MKLYYDLHLHSCLSPCGDGEMTHANLANMCALAGLDAVALTDHNTAGNCAPFLAAAARRGLTALPGMELCTREEIHMICLFPALDAAQAFSAWVRPRLPAIPNRPDIYGDQVLMDDRDGVLGRETALLAGAADVGVYEAAGLCARFGGLAYPAHIDRPSFSLLVVLGAWDPALGFPLAEVSRRCSPDLRARHPGLAGVPLLTGSDAHALEQIADAAHALEARARTPEAVLDALRGGAFPSLF